ncbi:MAG: WecB/TagA/CpsF family glycosyltransferase [Pseudomonadota bacterium]
MSATDANTVNVLGYEVSTAGLAGDVDAGWQLMRSGQAGGYVACANPHSLVVAAQDAEFAEALHEADVLLPDGAGIVLAGKVLRTPVSERVAGFEYFYETSRRANAEGGVRYFFLGSTQQVLDLIAERLAREFPNIELVGTWSPPYKPEFSEEDNAAMHAAIQAAQPDVVWVGMTAPKQEKWIHLNAVAGGAPLYAAIGAVFDFYAGTVKRSPEWAGRLGLEWLPRLLREPRRLWRRNFVSTPLFLGRILRQALFGN